LYSSLSFAQNRELEKYLEENISNVPSSLYDFSEWRSLLDLAQSMRLEETKRLGDSIYAKEFQFFKESNEQIRTDFLVECADIRAILQNFQNKIIPAMHENKAKHQSVRTYALTHPLTDLLTPLLTHLLTPLLTHSLTHPLTHSLTHSLTYSLTHF